MRILTFLLFLLPIAANAQIWSEDFDGSNSTNIPTWIEQCGDDNDYFSIVCQDGAGCPLEIRDDFVLNGATGQYFGVRDMDASPCSGLAQNSISFSDIDITSCVYTTTLYVCFDVAESRNMGGASGDEWSSSNNREDTWDSNASVFIRAGVDGNAMTTVTAIEALENSDTRPGIDVNCDGKANDAGEPELTDTFTTYCFELPSSGSTLDLEIEVNNLNTQGEDLAIDNIEVFCGTTPAGGTLLDACTPFQQGLPPSCTSSTLFFENFDGANTTNPVILPAACNASNATRDYFGIVCLDGAGCPNEINSDYIYNNASGQFFAVRDMDNECGGSQDETISFTGIDISSCADTSVLYLCLDMAESNPNNGREEQSCCPGVEETWDGNSSVQIGVSFDGCPFQDVTALEALVGSDSKPGIDTDCGGGTANPALLLTDVFTTYCFPLSTTGATLDLNINVLGLNTDGEDIAIDNIKVICADDPTCIPSAALPACTVAEPLTITCPANTTIQCDESIDPANTGMATAPDACPVPTVVAFADVSTQGTTGCEQYDYSVTRTWTATDAAGATAVCTQTITVEDTTPPVLTCPANVNIECGEIADVTMTGMATATDNCSAAAEVTIVFTDVESPLATGYSIARTWTATDACGNSAACTQTITVGGCDLEINDPCVCVDNASVIDLDAGTGGGDGQFSELVAITSVNGGPINNPNLVFEVTAITGGVDAFAAPPIPPAQTAGVPIPVGTQFVYNPVTMHYEIPFYHYEDVGYSITVQQIVAGAPGAILGPIGNTCDYPNPIFDPALDPLYCPNAAAFPLGGMDLNGLGSDAVSFTIDGAPATLFDPSALTVGTHIIMMTWDGAADANGGVSPDGGVTPAQPGCIQEVMQTIEVNDLVAPVITCPPGQTLTCFESLPAPLTNGTDFVAAGGTISDDCIMDLNEFTIFTQNDDNGGDNCPGNAREVVRTYFIADALGNTSTCTQTFTYQESTQGPVITSILPSCFKYCASLANPMETDITYDTDCSFGATVNIAGPTQIGQDNCPGTILRYTYTVTDDCGRTSAPVTRDFIIQNDGPTIECPSFNLMLECGDDNNVDYFAAHVGLVTANSSCGNGVVISHFPTVLNNVTCNSSTVVTFIATDDCGRTSSCTTIVNISDNTAPEITSVYEDGICNEAVCGSNLNFWFNNWKNKVMEGLSATDACDTNVSISPQGPNSPAQNCPDETTETVVNFVATDNCGNTSYIPYSFYVTAVGSPAPQASVSGLIHTEEMEAVEDVEVYLSGGASFFEMFVTSNDGMYAFNNVPLEQNYSITPLLDQFPMNGVSSYDLILIAQHILSVDQLDSPYKMIAADINRSGSITTLDLVELRKMILYINSDFPNNTSWRFVDANFVFPNATNPFATAFPEVVDINGLVEAIQNDFVGVKIGDVNGTAVANNLVGADDRSFNGNLNFNVKNQMMEVGETYEISFSSSDFEAIAGYQYTLNFNTELLEFVNVNTGDLAGMSESNFGLSLLNEGVITTSWTNDSAVSMKADAELFRITFKANRATQLSEALSVNSRYTAAEAYDVNTENGQLNLLNVNLRFEDVTGTSAPFALMQNTPNPFRNETVVGFVLPEASSATMTIYDVSGRQLKQISGDYKAGYNEIALDRSDLTEGILYYQLQASNDIATKKMIIIN